MQSLRECVLEHVVDAVQAPGKISRPQAVQGGQVCIQVMLYPTGYPVSDDILCI